MNAGPRNGHRRASPRLRLSPVSTSVAAETVAVSPCCRLLLVCAPMRSPPRINADFSVRQTYTFGRQKANRFNSSGIKGRPDAGKSPAGVGFTKTGLAALQTERLRMGIATMRKRYKGPGRFFQSNIVVSELSSSESFRGRFARYGSDRNRACRTSNPNRQPRRIDPASPSASSPHMMRS
jgi:hypothetical protein